jgi:hypothetical protein
MGDKPDSRGRVTRRGFIVGVPLGFLGAVAVGLVSGRALGSLFGRRGHAEPPKGSIFTPSKDRYTQT